MSHNRVLALIIALVFNLGLLIVFKYSNFIADNINYISGFELLNLPTILLPIGISFFTFQALSYIIDVYRNQVSPQKNFFDLALYISLFPQLIAGPIVRYHDINDQLKQRSITLAKFESGVQRFIIGFVKKILIADNMAYIADTVFNYGNTELDTALAWIGILAYTFQIYFDFSGYSDMAIGLGRMLGFEFLENFNYPYIAKSVKEFWRRWHISLSTWFRDYLYIPLGGNRSGITRTYINLIIVFLLTGIWHGAKWNFVVWGMYHGLFLIIERVLKPKKILPVFSHAYLLIVVVVGWVFFRADTLAHAINYLEKLFIPSTSLEFPNNVKYLINKEVVIISVLAVILSTPVKNKLQDLIQMNSGKWGPILKTSYYSLLIALFLISISYMAADTYSPFIYFRF
ncbi:MAG: MBOAT family O-acyltransferase [Fulvivirga sp.]|uniref:MBOAT family O-acyltransferase n=1 Tax=Fulvivirga sp. TaxID=1931237 RepID=UPI0032EC40D9